MNYFVYNGVSSLDMGLRIESKNVFSAPEYDVTFQSIPGRNGDLILPNGRYPNVQVTYSVFLPAKSIAELAEKITKVKAWLYGEQNAYHSLSDSYDTLYTRKAVYSGSLDIEEAFPIQCEVKGAAGFLQRIGIELPRNFGYHLHGRAGADHSGVAALHPGQQFLFKGAGHHPGSPEARCPDIGNIVCQDIQCALLGQNSRRRRVKTSQHIHLILSYNKPASPGVSGSASG